MSHFIFRVGMFTCDSTGTVFHERGAAAGNALAPMRRLYRSERLYGTQRSET